MKFFVCHLIYYNFCDCNFKLNNEMKKPNLENIKYEEKTFVSQDTVQYERFYLIKKHDFITFLSTTQIIKSFLKNKIKILFSNFPLEISSQSSLVKIQNPTKKST